MGDDLRRKLARAQLNLNRQHRPMSFREASRLLKDPNRQDIRVPVIVDPDSLLKSPEDVKTHLDLDTVPMLEFSTKTDKLPRVKWTPEENNCEKFTFCDVPRAKCWLLQSITEGEHITIWFRGNPRNAWRATAFKDVSKPPEDTGG